ncbi:hypothetical protein HK104_011286 [Borealophlyctis nickersoniae]|nr:hypothetical protein HK104_011286 [Borealophlyctis nickersoniae]
MSKAYNFSLHPVKEKPIFQLNRESAVETLKEATLSTAQKFEQLDYINTIVSNAAYEGQEMRNHIANGLEKDDFSNANRTLNDNHLQRFINNHAVFKWFEDERPDIARRIKAGLKERTAPKKDNEKIRALEARNRQVKEKLRHMDALLKKQQSKQKRIKYKPMDEDEKSRKKHRVAEPEQKRIKCEPMDKDETPHKTHRVAEPKQKCIKVAEPEPEPEEYSEVEESDDEGEGGVSEAEEVGDKEDEFDMDLELEKELGEH